MSTALSEIADAVRPAVVNISTTSVETMEDNPFGDMFNDPLFRRFFGDQFGEGHPGQKRKFKQSALGSGVIVSEQGYILTNNHVVKGAEEIKVTLFDKREFKGKVVGTDSRSDLAVVKINAKDLPTLVFGDSGRMKMPCQSVKACPSPGWPHNPDFRSILKDKPRSSNADPYVANGDG